MKKYTVLFSSLLMSGLIILSACGSSRNAKQSDLVQNSQWQKDSLQANGDDNDWTQPFSFSDEKTGLSYTVSNDRDNLYVLAATANEATIQRILRGGLTLYINHHGVKEEAGAAGISFPTGNRVQRGDKLLNDRPELQQNKRVAIGSVEDYSLFGFNGIKTPENFDYGKPNAEGIQLGIGLNTAGALVYEAAIPLASFLNKSALTNPGRSTIAVGLVLETLPDQPGSRGGGGGLSIGGGFGFGSFGRSSGVGLSIGSGSLARIGGGGRQGKATRIWKEVQLAKPALAAK
ncbi:MAG: hypothetical protein HYU71_01330 [Bacteroidetes bacterium]|nr:hypothetical protein [Bacteroidota bacterium]